MPRKIDNERIAEILEEIGLILEAKGVAYKPQAYEHAAATVRGLDEELARMYERCGTDCIDDLAGIGESIAEKIEELVTTGDLAYYAKLKKKYPLDLLAFTEIHDVGAKTAVKLYKKLGVKTLKELEDAARAGEVVEVKGFGEKTQEQILAGIAFLREHGGRTLLHEAYPLGRTLVKKLKKIRGVTHADAAGSLRRMKETIGDIDILVTAKDAAQVKDAFKGFPEVSKVSEEGGTKLTVRFANGVNGDLRVLAPEEYGAGLLYFSGSKQHNIDLRQIAIKKDMKLSEYGLFKGDKRIAGKTEKEIYDALNLPYTPPELREWDDIIDAAQTGQLPDLVAENALKGDCQVQTDWTDGNASIAEMAEAAKNLGLAYICITDHTKSLPVTDGLDEKQLKEQAKEIEKLNERLKNFRVLKSTECDILKDGSLDLSDDALKALDVVSVSVHTHFGLDKKTQTERVIRALKHPLVNILFHPTARIVNKRGPIDLDMERVFKAAAEYGVALEINGSARLDLKDSHIRAAREYGCKFVVSSDAHAPEEIADVRYGLAQARRGWAEKADILNTKSADAFLKALKK